LTSLNQSVCNSKQSVAPINTSPVFLPLYIIPLRTAQENPKTHSAILPDL
jgi:hypothetical protein